MMLMACPSSFCASCTGTRGIRLSGLSLVSRPGPEGSDCQQNQTANKELQALQHQAAPVFCSTALTSSQIQAGGGDNCRRELRYSVTLAGRIFLCHTHTAMHRYLPENELTLMQFVSSSDRPWEVCSLSDSFYKQKQFSVHRHLPTLRATCTHKYPVHLHTHARPLPDAFLV